MIQTLPAEASDSLFTLLRNAGFVPLTDSVTRKHLKAISLALKLASPLTFRAFRRVGASWAFHNGVPLEFIKNMVPGSQMPFIHIYCPLLHYLPLFHRPLLLFFTPSPYLALGCFSISKFNHLPSNFHIWLTDMWHGFPPPIPNNI